MARRVQRKKKFPLLLLLKKNKQTNKQTNKKAKSLVLISNVGDQISLGLVLSLSQASADLQQRVDLPRCLRLWSSAVSSTTCIRKFHQIRKGKWFITVCTILYFGVAVNFGWLKNFINSQRFQKRNMNLKIIPFMHFTTHMNKATKLTYKGSWMLVLHA